MAVPNILTASEYLALEVEAESKHEFCDGEIRAMAGATPRHVLLATRLSTSLAALSARGCSAFGSDLRVRVDVRFYTYPDVTVICGQPMFTEDGLCATNPMMLIEVSSTSTEGYDRGLKFARYKQIESLRYFLVVAQDRVQVDVFERTDSGSWLVSVLESESDEIAIDEWRLSLGDLYENVAILTT